jgi:transcriptional regulator with XRE-family HTH domain
MAQAKTIEQNTKHPRPVDVHVGHRVRARRMLLNISQEKLGEALGLTFQQIQKYEKGTNRIGASRLHQIAHVLSVPHEFFFEGLPHDARQMETESALRKADNAMVFSQSHLGARLAAAFAELSEPQKRAFVKLVEATAEEHSLLRQHKVANPQALELVKRAASKRK